MYRKYKFDELSLASKERVCRELVKHIPKPKKVIAKVQENFYSEMERLGYVGVLGADDCSVWVRGDLEPLAVAKLARRLLPPKEAKYVRWAMVAGTECPLSLWSDRCFPQVENSRRRKNIARIVDKLADAVSVEIAPILTKANAKLRAVRPLSDANVKIAVKKYCDDNELEFNARGEQYPSASSWDRDFRQYANNFRFNEVVTDLHSAYSLDFVENVLGRWGVIRQG